ncbi:MAG: aldo/keto reductase [Armatimonadetes bacterium]|nr:aldo/keto reductase [Armatimonadota bacterium]
MEQDVLAGLPRRRFGRLGWQVAPIGLGGAWLRGRAKERKPLEEAAETVLGAVRLGIDLIDTSIRYGDSELVIGQALKQLPPAARPRIATKSQVIKEPHEPAAGVYDSCLRSLARLGLERVDLFQIHEVEMYGWDRIMGPKGALEGLRRCRDEGLCEGIGVTGRPPDLLARLVDTGEFDSVLTYYEYDLLTAAATRELMPAAERHEVAVIAGSPARMGLFARPDGARWDHQPADVRARVPRLEQLLGKAIHELADESVRYLLADERIANISIGSSRLSSLESSIAAAAEGPLDPELVERLREIGLS